MTKTVDLPVTVMEQLLQLAERLPARGRSEFLKRAAHGLSELALENRNTIVFALAGWVLGEILDNLLSVPIPFSSRVLELTGDHLSTVGLAAGGVFGFVEDRKRNSLEYQISAVIQREIQRAASLA